MALIVQKFGGTSVGDMTRIRHVAEIIKKEHDQGHHITAVVSAMRGVTDQLVNFILQANPTSREDESLQEHDTILAAGEQVTAGLLALCLQDMGIPSRSFLSWQLPLETDDNFTNANATSVNTKELQMLMSQGGVPIVAGFQGIHKGRITTLGRGGSDATAVILAHGLKADLCDIYTDVSGVFTADPRVISKAQKIPLISFDEMLELSNQGAKVLQAKSVALAKKHQVRLRVLSSFENASGTEVALHGNTSPHQITGIAHHFLDAWVMLKVGGDPAYSSEKLKDVLEAHRFTLQGITTMIHDTTRSELHFAIRRADLFPVVSLLKAFQGDIAFSEITTTYDMANITLVGSAVHQSQGFVTDVLKQIKSLDTKAEVLVIGAHKFSFMIPEQYATQVLETLHQHFITTGHSS